MDVKPTTAEYGQGLDGGSSGPDSSEGDPRIAELEFALNDREAKLREAVALYDQGQRDWASAKARIEREERKQVGVAQDTFLRGFLDVLDDLDRAIDVAMDKDIDPAVEEGLLLVEERFLSKLREHGVERLETKERFDPNYHEAVAIAKVVNPSDNGTVVEVVEHGYVSGDHVLRPARVVVGRS